MKLSSKCKMQNAKIRWAFFKQGLLIFALCIFLFDFSTAAIDPTAPRLFFSDANISFRFPNHWKLDSAFPYGPLFTKQLRDGSTATILCAISAPLNPTRVSADLPLDALKELAIREMEDHQPGYKTISKKDLQLSGQNAFQIVWDNASSTQTLRHQSVYFFVESRVYVITLQAKPRVFRWIAPDFQNWLQSLRILSRKASGELDTPSHGGLWIHQTAAAKIFIPEEWLVGVADDRMLGATFASEALHNSFTATVDPIATPPKEFTRDERKEAVKAVRRKGLRVVSETETPFHGFPSLQVQYEGEFKDRLVRGRDIWVLSPKARWLFNLEGDVSLYNSRSNDFEQILNAIQFL